MAVVIHSLMLLCPPDKGFPLFITMFHIISMLLNIFIIRFSMDTWVIIIVV